MDDQTELEVGPTRDVRKYEPIQSLSPSNPESTAYVM